MPTTYEEAYDEMRRLFYETWNDWIGNGKPQDIRQPNGVRDFPLGLTVPPDNTIYIPEVRWRNVEKETAPALSKHWCRFTSQTVDTNQTGLRTGTTGDRKARHTSYGIIIVQMFYSKTSLRAKDERRLSVIARDIFMPRNLNTNPIWYRNARINELPPEENWFRANVVADYQFDELI